MLANLRAPEVGLPLAASPSEKTARAKIVPQVRDEVNGRDDNKSLRKCSERQRP